MAGAETADLRAMPPRTRAPVWAGLFSGPGASAVTVALLALLAWAAWHLFDWGVVDAVLAPDVPPARPRNTARAGASSPKSGA
jgi:hypothetical protein